MPTASFVAPPPADARARVVACALLLALPWLWPLTPGPSPAVAPYLVAAATAGLLLLAWPRQAASGARAITAGWLLAASVSALIALLQYLNWEAPFYPWINQAQAGQAFGNLRQPNQLATHLLLGLAALIALNAPVAPSALNAPSSPDSPPPARWRRPAALLLAAALLTALAATASRTGLLGLLALAGLHLLWAWRARRLRPALLRWGGALALYALAALALPAALQVLEGPHAGRDLLHRLQTAESTCGSRLILWRNVWHLISLKPWTGWGWGDLAWAHYDTLYEGARFCHILDNAHNLPLHLAVSLGLPAAAVACAAVAWAIWRLRPWAETQPVRQLAWGALLALGLHSLVEYPLWYGPFQIAAACALWLLWATRAGAAGQPAAPATRRASAALAVAVLAASAYAAWDYWRISQLYLKPEQRTAWWRQDPLSAAQQSWLFAGAVRFAHVTVQTPSAQNAAWLLPEALRALHYSPETRVIRRVIESAAWLDQDDVALYHLARFHAAFPSQAQAWQSGLSAPPASSPP